MPLPRVIRNALYISEGVIIGEPEPELTRPAWRMAPPPPPPAVEPDPELDDLGPHGHHRWSGGWDDEGEAEQSSTAEAAELESQQKLAEAEQLIAEAGAEAERLVE